MKVHCWINQILARHELKFENLTGFVADNTNSNFGGVEQRGTNNLFFRLRQQKQGLIGLGCPAHILHNAARIATDKMRIFDRAIDIEAIVFKLSSYFKMSTKRSESLKEHCRELEVCKKKDYVKKH